MIKPHGAAASVERGSPYGVLEQYREGFWKKSQHDEITICLLIWDFGLFRGHNTGVLGWAGKWACGAAKD